MPTAVENINYLYLILTNDGPPTIDWAAVGAAMNLKASAVAKRWSRLKQSMDKDETPAASHYQFLWICLKNSKRNKAVTWADIAAKCGTTSGAASKRFSRMKQAFEKDGGLPSTGKTTSTPANAKASASTRKSKKTTDSPDDDGDTDVAQTSTLKGKRKAIADDEDHKSKRVKSAKVIPKPKGVSKGKAKAKFEDDAETVEGEDIVKAEMPDEQDETHDATEHVEDDGHDSVDNDNEAGSHELHQDWLNHSV